MTATAAMISILRRMIAEPTTTTYSDAQLATFIEAYPMLDSAGLAPDADDWTAAYNLNLAAADVWDEKAAAMAIKFDFSADGTSYKQSQIFAQYKETAKTLRETKVRAARSLP